MRDIRIKRILLCTITIFFWLAQYVYLPFLTPYLFSISISATVIGVIIGAYGFTQMVLRIPLGFLGDIIRNHKLFIMAGVFLAGASSIVMVFSPNSVPMLIVANGISGIASSAWVSFTILFSTYYERTESFKAMGVITIYQNIGTLLAYILGGIIFEEYGIRMLFILSFIFGMVGFILSVFIKNDHTESLTNSNILNYIKVIKDKKLLLASCLCSIAFFILFATVFSFTTSTIKQLGGNGLQIGICTALFSIGSIIGAYFSGTKSITKIGPRYILCISFILISIYCLGIALTTNVWSFFPLQIMCGIAGGMLGSTLMGVVIKDIDNDRKSTAMGFYQSVYSMGMTAGPIVMGLLIQNTSNVISFKVMGLLAICCAFGTYVFYKSIMESECIKELIKLED